MTCENCAAPAATALDDGTPVCWSCRIEIEREAAYADGFADALNDAAPDLIPAIAAVLASANADSLARLRAAFASLELEAAA